MTEHNTLTENDIAERAAFLASCDADERADAESIFALIDEHSARPTLIPSSYPALEQEAYSRLSDSSDTLAPPPSRQIGLELECSGLEVAWS